MSKCWKKCHKVIEEKKDWVGKLNLQQSYDLWKRRLASKEGICLSSKELELSEFRFNGEEKN